MTLTFDLLTLLGIIYSSRTICIPRLKLLGQSVLELSVVQCVGDWHVLWPWPLTYWPEYKQGPSTHQGLSTYQFLVHLSRRLKCIIVIMRCPSSVRLSVRPSLTFHIFDFFSETTERSSTKLVRKQYLNALYQFCVFHVDRKNKMATLASDWLRHFRLLLWNRWKEFNETWQEAISHRPLASYQVCVFRTDLKNKMAA